MSPGRSMLVQYSNESLVFILARLHTVVQNSVRLRPETHLEELEQENRQEHFII